MKDFVYADKWKLNQKFSIAEQQIYYHTWEIDYRLLSEKVGAREKSFSKGEFLLRIMIGKMKL